MEIASQLEFQNYVSNAISQGLEEYLADYFEVSISTVYRWANGVAEPHPRIRLLIIAEIKKALQ